MDIKLRSRVVRKRGQGHRVSSLNRGIKVLCGQFQRLASVTHLLSCSMSQFTKQFQILQFIFDFLITTALHGRQSKYQYSHFTGKNTEIINLTNVTAITSVNRMDLWSSCLPLHAFPTVPHC